ncbi:FAD-binding protein [Jiangella endophytica]|uniref:FAD-binding protein n=1 Tax=Jiangella endophytica TaxID=1623398 RepID=UPI000E346F92|nr:FAD-binding protein [Jiangella endophytica]
MTPRERDPLRVTTDVLVVGGGPAATWAALAARAAGAEVLLVDKGYCGTSGVTASAGTTHWLVPPKHRAAAAAERDRRGAGLTDPAYLDRTMDQSWRRYQPVAAAIGYPATGYFRDVLGERHLVQGPVYMKEMRRRVRRAGARILDHAPALGLLRDGDGQVRGARGVLRQEDRAWSATAGGVVLATGGCAFRSGALGSHVNTGDGLLMAAEVGAALSGMEFSNYYGLSPAGAAMEKNLYFRTATYTDADGAVVAEDPDEIGAMVTGRVALMRARLAGPLYAVLDRTTPAHRADLRAQTANAFLVFDRLGIDPFRQRFEVDFVLEGTIRGSGGVRTLDPSGWTGVPGLWAAGDTASREPLVGASSGAGAPNSSWTVASGSLAGSAAARHALASATWPAPAAGTGTAGVSAGRTRGRRPWRDVVDTVQAVMLPMAPNAFRSAGTLAAGLRRLDATWRELRELPAGTGRQQVEAREAAAMLAAARWVQHSALARTESRGLHRRLDHPGTDSAQRGHVLVHGVDHPVVQRIPAIRKDPVR